MIYRLSLLVLLIVLSSSCMNEQERQQRASKIAQQQFEKVDLSKLDQYPLFPNCDEMLDNKECFSRELHSLIHKKLASSTNKIELIKQDSISISITVTKEGNIKYDSLVTHAHHVNSDQITLFLSEALTELPRINSALKKDIPVSSSFIVPVVFEPIEVEY